MASCDNVTELDLLAYADGRLDAERERQVRDYLASRPDLQAKLADFARQNEELQACFGRYGDEPLPEHIQAMLSESGAQPARRRHSVVRQAIAASVLMLATGSVGWWIGSLGDGDSAMENFLERAASFHSQAQHVEGLVAASDGVGGGQPLNWFSEKISFELSVPDLSSEGYQLVDNQRINFEGRQGVVLRYRSEEGASVDVFMKTRWQEDLPGYRTMRSGDVSLAYWMDGPLAVAIAAREGQEGELTAVAEALRDAIGRKDGESSPDLKPGGEDSTPAQEAGVLQFQDLADPSALHPTIRSNSGTSASGQM